ncbi:acylphosphatase [Bacillaceae bacterium Marseille-Q3522]|nr:acylphosphatase [Bacillaceae bacterium Marseille-Q3522]
MIQLHLVVSGRVQGVGFRYFAHKLANEFAVNGWVKNSPNGDVEIMVTGEKDVLDSFIEKLKKGNRFAKVKHIAIHPREEIEPFSSFQIKHY